MRTGTPGERGSYVSGVLLVHQLVAGREGVPVLLADQLLHLLVGQADAVVEIAAPEHVVMGVQQPALWDTSQHTSNGKEATCVFSTTGGIIRTVQHTANAYIQDVPLFYGQSDIEVLHTKILNIDPSKSRVFGMFQIKCSRNALHSITSSDR